MPISRYLPSSSSLALLMAAVTALILGGCGDGTGPSASPVGRYSLVAIDGRPLPFKFLFSEILSGSVTLHSGGTYTASTTTRDEDIFTATVATVTDSETGRWSHRGSTIHLTQDGGLEASARYDGSTLELDAIFFVLTYQR